MSQAVNLSEKLDSFQENWVPKVVAELNGQFVKVVKCENEYVWHHHDNEDEMFLVLDGLMEIHLRDEVIPLSKREFFVVPRGVEHKPVVPSGVASVLLFEPSQTRNTGNVDHGYTIEANELEKI